MYASPLQVSSKFKRRDLLVLKRVLLSKKFKILYLEARQLVVYALNLKKKSISGG
jgi:hypothetical protein